MNCLNSFLVEGKTRSGVGLDLEKTKFGSGRAIRSGVAELLLKFCLVESGAESAAELHNRFQ